MLHQRTSSISIQQHFKQIFVHCHYEVKVALDSLKGFFSLSSEWYKCNMISYDFRQVILSGAGCSVSLRCQHLASRSGNTAGNNPAEAGWWNYFILFCAVTHVTTEKYIGLLVSPCDPKAGKVVRTQSQPQVKNYWCDGLMKLFSFPMAMLGNFHLSCHKRLNSQNSILFLFKGRAATGINRSSTGMK